MENRLREMAATNEALAGETSINGVLARLACRAREITGADFAAVSTFDDAGAVERFMYTGIDDLVAQQLGSPPTGRGILGELAESHDPVRIDDLVEHPRFTGWPARHPDMSAFLGIPIRTGGRSIGSLYMTRERGKPPFTAEDEIAGAVLALQAAVSLTAAVARERVGRIMLLEERERIAHDLHDGTIQTLYALGLRFDAALRVANVPIVRDALIDSIESINHLITDLRDYITMLEAEASANEPELSRDIPAVVHQVVPAGIDTVVNIAAAALNELSSREIEDLLYLTREALSNAVRHGQPTKVAVDLRQTEHETALTIQDNGIGFDQTAARRGFGTVTMESRADRLGGRLTVVSIPGMGTIVRITVPRGEAYE